METFSFTMYTFLGTRGRHTNANSMLDNAMLHVDVIRRKERELKIEEGKLYCPGVALHLERALASVFRVSGGANGMNKNNQIDFIDAKRNKSIQQLTVTEYKNNQELILIAHCIERYIHDKQPELREVARVEQISNVVLERAKAYAHLLINKYREAKIIHENIYNDVMTAALNAPFPDATDTHNNDFFENYCAKVNFFFPSFSHFFHFLI